jgi:hypothetical protein
MHSTSNLDDGYMGSGKRLRRSINKHGKDNHIREILEFFENRELLIEAEIKAITSEMVLDKDCMNLMYGGKGGFISEEQQRHRSICGSNVHAEKMKNDLVYRERVIKQSRINLEKYINSGKHNFKTFTGKNHTNESKEKMREKAKLRIGENNSQYGTCWITKDNLNKKIKKEELEIYLNEGWIKGRK